MTLSLAVYLVVNNGMNRFLSSMLSPAGLWSPLVMKLTGSIVGLPTMVIHDRSATMFRAFHCAAIAFSYENFILSFSKDRS